MKKLIRLSMIMLMLTVGTGGAYGTTLFSDDFETGDRSHTENNAGWTNATSTTVTADIARSGSHALAFHFEGSSSGDAWAEQRFDLGTNLSDVYIRFYIYFPANYAHRNVSPNNNKVIRIWSDPANYSGDDIKMGASLARDASGISQLFPEMNATYSSGWQPDYNGSMEALISMLGSWTLSPADLEKWICFEFHFKRDSGQGDGAFEFWVDGERQFGSTAISFKNAPPSPDYFRSGYLLGWSNSGFDEYTTIYIDDVAFGNTYIGPDGSGQQALAAPTGLKVVDSN